MTKTSLLTETFSSNSSKPFSGLLLPFALCLLLGTLWYKSIQTEKEQIPEQLAGYIKCEKDAQEIFKSLDLLAAVVNNLNNSSAIGQRLYFLNKTYYIKNSDEKTFFTTGDWCLIALGNLQYSQLPEKPSKPWVQEVTQFMVKNSSTLSKLNKISIASKQSIIDTWVTIMKKYPPLKDRIKP